MPQMKGRVVEGSRGEANYHDEADEDDYYDDDDDGQDDDDDEVEGGSGGETEAGE